MKLINKLSIYYQNAEIIDNNDGKVSKPKNAKPNIIHINALQTKKTRVGIFYKSVSKIFRSK